MKIRTHIIGSKAILRTILPPLFIQFSTLPALSPQCAAVYRSLPQLIALYRT
jgi:hypothetical protein